MTDRLERLINLVIALRETRRPLTAEQIHERVAGYDQDDHRAFRRMFERDKSDLRALGVPVETTPVDRLGDEVGYRIDPERYALPEVEFAPGELAALALAVEATGLSDEAAGGLRKLEVAGGPGPAAPQGHAIRMETVLWPTLVEAQVQRMPVRFDYAPLGRGEHRRTVDPYGLVLRRGRWYLVGRDHDRDAVRAFRLDRVSGRIKPAGQPGAFDSPPAVRVDDVVPERGAAPEFATVDAAPAVAWQVARRARGPGEETADGWVRFTVPVGGRQGFLRWALGLGADLEVLAPAKLRDDVIRALASLAGEQL